MVSTEFTSDTALRLSKYFGNSAGFWMGIQDEYDLREESKKIESELRSIPRANFHCFQNDEGIALKKGFEISLPWLARLPTKQSINQLF